MTDTISSPQLFKIPFPYGHIPLMVNTNGDRYLALGLTAELLGLSLAKEIMPRMAGRERYWCQTFIGGKGCIPAHRANELMSILRVSHDKGSIVAWLGNHACKALHDFQIPTPAIPLIPDEDVSVVHPISSPASPKAGLQTFNFGAHPIRTVMVGVEPFWVAKDVAEALGYSWNGSARIEHVPEEWRGITSVVTPSGTQDMAVLSEQGLYFFLGRSDKAAALPMQKWVAGEVLPSIRKTGSYGVQQFKVPQTLCEALRLAADIESKRMELACKVELQAEELKTAEPAIKFHAQVGGTPDAISIGEFAKILGTGQNRFFAWLRDHGYIMKRQILPYQTWINQGIFIVKEIAFEDTHGVDRVSPKTYITGRGQIHLQNVWTMLEGK